MLPSGSRGVELCPAAGYAYLYKKLFRVLSMPMPSPQNPLQGLVPAEIYAMLEENNLLNEKGVRDYQMRSKFKRMRDRDVPAADAIEQIREDYPYLQFDTIRKIVYGLRRKRG